MAAFKVEICGVNTAKLPLLSAQEKTELLKMIKEGDKQARDKYIKGNLRLVLSVVQRFSGSNENMDDLFQIGCIGLIKAIDNFDITQQVKFSTYAVPMIIGEIRRYLRDTSSQIRVSRSLKDTAYKAIYARERLSKTNLREPTLNEIAGEIGASREDVIMALYVMDQISDKKHLEENWVKDMALKDAVNRLPERERMIIELRFFQGKTQMEVAGEIGMSQAQVSRLEKNALNSMKHYLE